MTNWRDVLASAMAAEPPQIDATRDVLGVPTELAEQVRGLRSAIVPRVVNLSVWPVIVSDAQRLLDNGWAATALALGWHSLELFGCGRKDSGTFEGLRH